MLDYLSFAFVRRTYLFVLIMALLSCGGGGSDPQPTNHAPVAFAGPSQNVTTGTLVTLDGTGSYDEDGDPLTYGWALTNVPAGSTAVLSGATSSRPTFIPNVSGDYWARLIVNDGRAESVKAPSNDPQQEKVSEFSYVITAYITPPPSSAGDNQLWKMERAESSRADTIEANVEHFGGPYRIVAKHSNKVLDVTGRSTADGANVQQYTYNGGDHQKWTFHSYSSSNSGPYTIMVQQKRGGQSLCLDVENGSMKDRANVQQYQCTGNDNQLWYANAATSNEYIQIMNKKSGKCLDVEERSLADGANVIQFTCR